MCRVGLWDVKSYSLAHSLILSCRLPHGHLNPVDFLLRELRKERYCEREVIDGIVGDVQMLVQRQEAERELNERLQKMQADKQTAVEMAATLQRTLATIDAEKRKTERSAIRLQKDKSALKKTLDKVVQRVLLCTVA